MNYLYLRGLRQADHTVFCVANGQKTYRDPRFPYPHNELAYSSGQQVKRSILDVISHVLNERRAPIIFVNELGPKKMEQKEPWSPCDPTYVDQLLGGWMRAEKRTGDKEGGRTIKRRSPLSISAMRPLHPLLAEIYTENLSFDRTDDPQHHKVIVRDAKGKIVPDEEVRVFLESNNLTLTRRRFIQDQKRTTGLFIYDVAIDLRRLFKVSADEHDPELDRKMVDKLRMGGWQEVDGHLVCPPERRDQIIKALAYGLINWHITSNQARTFSPMTMLALAISNNANHLGSVIRADLSEEDEVTGRSFALPVVTRTSGAAVFVSPACRSVIASIPADDDALGKAEAFLVEQLRAFDYDA